MKGLIILLFIQLNCVFAFSQDAHFSQYNATRLYTNPSFAGTDSALIINTGFRYQWPNISGGYRTFSFSADQYVGFLKGGFGLNYTYDDQMVGVLKKTAVDLIYSPQIRLFKNKLILKPSIQASIGKNTLDWSKLTFGDQIDARRGFIYNSNEVSGINSRFFIDFSSGLLVYANHFNAGVAVHHLTQPDQGFMGPSKLPMRITFHGGGNFGFRNLKYFTFFPNVVLQKQQDFQMLITGVNVRYKKIIFGLNYRFYDAPIAMIGFQNRFLKISYSFDYTLSNLTIAETGGSHELQLTCFLHYQKKRNVAKVLHLL
ncbi:MAG: PorP/SprF family type IX secretion system membrane protein [Bacteroidia bacterium]